MLAWLSTKLLKWRGWTLVGHPPQINKYVVIVAPHTSNWDFFIFLALKFSLKLQVNFVGKHTIFVGPIGWILRRLGGRPVDRSKSHNVVSAIVDLFNQNDKFIFALSPEGTRSYKDHWKSGFYYIAVKAKVPIQTCFLDTTNRTLGFGPLIEPCGDLEQDQVSLRSIFENKRGINPELFSDITFTKHP